MNVQRSDKSLIINIIAGAAELRSLVPDGHLRRCRGMTETIATLRQKMENAALALDFEEAKRCRDMISMLRSGAAPADVAQADFDGLERQQPGAMGLGTSQQRVSPPAGWTRPSKPDPMTTGRSLRGRQRRP